MQPLQSSFSGKFNDMESDLANKSIRKCRIVWQPRYRAGAWAASWHACAQVAVSTRDIAFAGCCSVSSTPASCSPLTPPCCLGTSLHTEIISRGLSRHQLGVKWGGFYPFLGGVRQWAIWTLMGPWVFHLPLGIHQPLQYEDFSSLSQEERQAALFWEKRWSYTGQRGEGYCRQRAGSPPQGSFQVLGRASHLLPLHLPLILVLLFRSPVSPWHSPHAPVSHVTLCLLAHLIFRIPHETVLTPM